MEFNLNEFVQSCKKSGFSDQHIMQAFAFLKRQSDPEEFLSDFCAYEHIDTEAQETLIAKYGDVVETAGGDLDGRSYADQFYSDASTGVAANMAAVANYARKTNRRDAELDEEWINSVEDTDLDDAIETMIEVNKQFEPVKQHLYLDKTQKMNIMQQMIDEDLMIVRKSGKDRVRTVAEANLDEFRYGEEFGVAYPPPPNIVEAVDIAIPSALSQVQNFHAEDVSKKDQYPFITCLEDIKKLMLRRRDKYATNDMDLTYHATNVLIDGPWYLCTTRKDIAHVQEQIGDEEFESLIQKDSTPPADPIRTQYMTLVPLANIRAYKTLKTAPGKSFYYHEKNRGRFFAHLKRVRVVAGGKKNLDDVAKRAKALLEHSQKPIRVEERPVTSKQPHGDLPAIIYDIIEKRTTEAQLFSEGRVSAEVVNAFDKMKGSGKGSFFIMLRKKLADKLSNKETVALAIDMALNCVTSPQYKHLDRYEMMLVATANCISMLKVDNQNEQIMRY